MAGRRGHWEEIYRSRAEDDLGWYEAEAALSLELIAAHAQPGEAIIDAGGGRSRLVDGLLSRGLGPVTVLDLSATALEGSRTRLGARASEVEWIEADITEWQPTPGRDWSIWHDRAVFHFLTEPADRALYVSAMRAALAPGGLAIMATFAEDGPERCAGLAVQRWSSQALAAELHRIAPERFALIDGRRHVHRTPSGVEQPYRITLLRHHASRGIS
ncbi:class I SAM-dependent methyltransferase [Tropicimonas aquimaris]|uniref:Class I SAM-dependent methyltransferase n=1 Tax=Tropicimonas aquimaris TaxID=914152 RepID=A0ABW3IW90_9RHOB